MPQCPLIDTDETFLIYFLFLVLLHVLLLLLQASENQTLSVRVLLIQASCLDGIVNVRDNNDSRLVNRFGFFNHSADFQFNTTGPEASFELAADNISCRLNMELEVIARGKKLTDGQTSGL